MSRPPKESGESDTPERRPNCATDASLRAVPTVRDNKGRFAAGNKNRLGKSPARHTLPPWFKDRGEDALRTLLACATGIYDGCNEYQINTMQICDPKDRIRAAEAVVERIFGKTVTAIRPEEEEMPGTQEDLAVAAEKKLWALANGGDTKALQLILAANDPRYAPANKAVETDSNSVDTVDFVPLVANEK